MPPLSLADKRPQPRRKQKKKVYKNKKTMKTTTNNKKTKKKRKEKITRVLIQKRLSYSGDYNLFPLVVERQM